MLKCILHLLDLEPGVQSHDAPRSQIVVVHATETSLLHHVLELLLQQSKQINAVNTALSHIKKKPTYFCSNYLRHFI